jgi:hypothetical protein
MTKLRSDHDDATTQRLLQLAQRHYRLALEHSSAKVLPDRREAIRAEIERLRAEREVTLNQVPQIRKCMTITNLNGCAAVRR